MSLILSVVALGWLLRRGFHEAVPLAMVAALAIAITSGVADIAALSHSQVDATPSWLARGVVVLAFGVGAGLAAAAFTHVRSTPPRHHIRVPG
jgi:hypothetical protein